MLRRSEAIVGEAPELPEWEFFAAKPAENWDYIFKMFDSTMLQQTINASEWKYLIEIEEEQKLKILFYTENIDFLDADDKLSAADFVLNQTIGEMDKIYYIDEVSFIHVLDENQREDLKPLKTFKFEFEKLVDRFWLEN